MPDALEVDSRFGGVPTETMEDDLKAGGAWGGLKDLSELRGNLTPERISEALGRVELLGLFEKAWVSATRGSAPRRLAGHCRFCVLGISPVF